MSDQDIMSAERVSSAPVEAPAGMGNERLEIGPAVSSKPRPLVSEDDEYMIESFVTGLLTCPEKYHDRFIDSWIDSHPAGHDLLLAAYSVVDLVEKFHKVGYGGPDKESA